MARAPVQFAGNIAAYTEGTLQATCLVRISHPHKDARHAAVPLQSITLISKATGTESPANYMWDTAYDEDKKAGGVMQVLQSRGHCILF